MWKTALIEKHRNHQHFFMNRGQFSTERRETTIFKLQVSFLSYLHRSDFVSESCSDSGVNVHPYDGHLVWSGLGHAVHRWDVTESAGVKQNLFVVSTL